MQVILNTNVSIIHHVNGRAVNKIQNTNNSYFLDEIITYN